MGDGWTTDWVTLLCDEFSVEIRAELGLEIRADLEKSKETRDCIPGREQNNLKLKHLIGEEKRNINIELKARITELIKRPLPPLSRLLLQKATNWSLSCNLTNL